ncbi:hypothetical protein ABZ714_00960 [Streptomyces sp. NPDC006798]|uniref:hypothetical protein n=1 Tax=Streptomyces sp. NPDC006798 TaxID=3155462 RepID=UPI0033E7EE60
MKHRFGTPVQATSVAPGEFGSPERGAVSFDRLKVLKTFQHTVTVETGRGDKKRKDDRVFSVYEPLIKLTPPPGRTMNGAREDRLFMLSPRRDAATCLPRPDGTGGKPTTKGAAAFAYISFLHRSAKADAKEKAVADHLRTAFTQPGKTKPVNARKSIPGAAQKKDAPAAPADNYSALPIYAVQTARQAPCLPVSSTTIAFLTD